MMLKSEPIYESLLARILKVGNRNRRNPAKKRYWTIMLWRRTLLCPGARSEKFRGQNSVFWYRSGGGERELIPKGKTRIQTGDVIITMTDEEHNGAVYDQMKQLCRNE